jgi:uncharacterized membrane protein
MVLVAALAGCGGGKSGTGTYVVQQLASRSGDQSQAKYVTNNGRVFGTSYHAVSDPAPHEDYANVAWETDGKLTVIRDGLDMSYTAVVNEQGLIAGEGPSGTLIYNPAGDTVVQLQSLPGSYMPAGPDYANANGINSAGIVVGETGWRPVKWDMSGTLSLLQGLPGETSGSAMDINSSGEISGRLGCRAVVWNADGTIKTQYPDVEGFVDARGLLINDAGYVVIGYCGGEDLPCGGSPTAFTQVVVKTPGGGSVALQNFGFHCVSVYDINASGQIVGAVGPEHIPDQAAVWNPDGTGTLLPVPTGTKFSNAHSINDSGTIVGSTADPNCQYSAAIWRLQ